MIGRIAGGIEKPCRDQQRFQGCKKIGEVAVQVLQGGDVYGCWLYNQFHQRLFIPALPFRWKAIIVQSDEKLYSRVVEDK